MILFPAVDIQHGQAVRLRQGVAKDVTVFADDPVDAAKRWEAEGARWLHVVDLDGAFAGDARSAAIVERICRSVAIPVQLGGGIRTLETAKRYLACGVARLIIGTLAIEEPETFALMCRAFPGKIGVSLDCDHGIVKTRGWLGASERTLEGLIPDLTARGASFVIYTDISRDGMQSGANLAVLEHLARTMSLPLIAAGGISSLADVQALYPLSRTGVLEGVISGRALYEGRLRLAEANAWIAAQETEV